MARTGDGAADYLEFQGTLPISAYPFSMSCWVNTSSLAGVQYLLQFSSSGSTITRMGLHIAVTGKLNMQMAISGATRAWETTSTISTNTWTNLVGTAVDANTCTAYINAVNTGSYIGTATANFPSINRVACGALRRAGNAPVGFLNGAMAEAGVWNVELSAQEAAMLAAGFSPLMVRPQSLVFYAPLFGRNGASGNEEDWVGGLTLTQTSSPGLADHPRIIYPRRTSEIWVPAAGGGYIHPTLSNARMTSLTSSSGIPNVDYAF